MTKKELSSFNSVISVNPYKNSYINGVSSFLNKTNSPQFSKDQLAISYLQTKDFITTQISISKNIGDEDLYDAITNKVYDDLALDQAVTYQIQFIETFNNLDENNRHFHVFIIDPSTIGDTFASVINQIKYLDVIIPIPLLIKSLYSKELIDDNGVHCFIYFQENDTFLTIYREKEFTYTKSIKYSFTQMYDRFCELYGEKIEYDEFINFIQKHNLKTTTSDYKEYFIKLYKEIFANINDILTYVKRAFEIEKIDHLYIGTQLQTLTKLDEIAEVELSIKTSNFEFNYGFESDQPYIDQINALMHLYTMLPEDQKYECNFTTFSRPPKFIQRDSGKLIMFTAASFIIAFIYPVTYWLITYTQTFQHETLTQQYTEMHNNKITRDATIKNMIADKEKIVTLLDKEKKDYINKKNTLIKIHDVKVNYPMKAKLLYILTQDLNKYKVKLKSLDYTQDSDKKHFKLNLMASSNTRITKLLKYLTKTHEGKFDFSLDKISYNSKTKNYSSELKVKLL